MKRRTVVVLPNAETDVDEIVTYIRKDNRAAARRFFEAFYSTLDVLVDYPNLGFCRFKSDPVLHDVRCYSVKDFVRYLIVYRLQSNRIEVIRVLHVAQNIEAILDEASQQD